MNWETEVVHEVPEFWDEFKQLAFPAFMLGVFLGSLFFRIV
jgi:hypothetical protein